jgi:hypothetical protein
METLNAKMLYPTRPLDEYMDFIIHEHGTTTKQSEEKVDMALHWVSEHEPQLRHEYAIDKSKDPSTPFVDWAITTYFFWKYNKGMSMSIDEQIEAMIGV